MLFKILSVKSVYLPNFVKEQNFGITKSNILKLVTCDEKYQ